MKQQNNSMFDGRFIVTMVLVMGMWMLWQSYMAKKYPDAYKKTAESSATATTPQAVEQKATAPSANTNAANKDQSPIQQASSPQSELSGQQEKLTRHADDTWEFDISSKGMSLRNVKLKKYKSRTGENISFASENGLALFGTSLVGHLDPIDFQITKTGDTQYTGEALVNGMKITKVFNLDPALYLIKTSVSINNINGPFTGLVTKMNERVFETKSSFLMPTFDHQEFYVFSDGAVTRTLVHHDKPMSESHQNVHIAGYGSQYFAAAIIDESPILPEMKAVTAKQEGRQEAAGFLTYNLINKNDVFNLKYSMFVGPKSYELLKSVDADLADIVNFGFFRSIAKGIFWLMKSIHAAIGNWGVAIIFLTILVRILVLPFNMLGYRQMKAMQVIQPQIKILREKYKNDQQKLNQEMMALMRDAKANPIGGCLPMFLQIPIFFALYQVIGQSIELYQAPFIFWIHDLSIKDPFYVLPVLMGVTMYIQQKITPNTLEPAQQKVMQFLPIFFSFLMLTLPSGLTLYIFISTIFGVLQQMYFMKNDKPTNLTVNKEPVT